MEKEIKQILQNQVAIIRAMEGDKSSLLGRKRETYELLYPSEEIPLEDKTKDALLGLNEQGGGK